MLALGGLLGLNLRPDLWRMWAPLVVLALVDAWVLAVLNYRAPSFEPALPTLGLAWLAAASFTLGLVALVWGLLRWKPRLERSPSPAPTQVSES